MGPLLVSRLKGGRLVHNEKWLQSVYYLHVRVFVHLAHCCRKVWFRHFWLQVASCTGHFAEIFPGTHGRGTPTAWTWPTALDGCPAFCLLAGKQPRCPHIRPVHQATWRPECPRILGGNPRLFCLVDQFGVKWVASSTRRKQSLLSASHWLKNWKSLSPQVGR